MHVHSPAGDSSRRWPPPFPSPSSSDARTPRPLHISRAIPRRSIALGRGGVASHGARQSWRGERAATAFRDWGAGYREGAELVHGYGTSRLRTHRADAADALDEAARRARRCRAGGARQALPLRGRRVNERRSCARRSRGNVWTGCPASPTRVTSRSRCVAHFYDSPGRR